MAALSAVQGDGGCKIVAGVRENHYICRAIVFVRAAIGDVVVVVIASDAERGRQQAS
jgi:hypothetical protein